MAVTELLRFLAGVALIGFPGYVWGWLLWPHMSIAGRAAWGLGLGAVGVTGLTMLCSLFLPVTSSLLFFLVAVVGVIPLLAGMIGRKPDVTTWVRVVPRGRQVLMTILLVCILAFIAYMTYLPHSVEEYTLPLHADEWIHWGYTRGFMEAGSLDFPNPLTGEEEAVNPEIGFHAFLGCFRWLSGVSLRTVFLFLPATLAVLTGLAAFAWGEEHKRGYGWGAAFFVAFVPTTVRFLGPSFLVPLSLGLFLTLVVILTVQRKDIYRYPVIALVVLFAAVMHPPSAVAMVVVLVSHAVMLPWDKRYREAGLLALATLAPFLVAYLVIPQRFFVQGINAFFGEKYVSHLSSITLQLETMSLIVWALFFLGSFVALWKGRALLRGLPIATTGFIVAIFAYDTYGFGLPILYDRFFSYTFLCVALLAGVGLAEVGYLVHQGFHLGAERWKHPGKKWVVQGGSLAVAGMLCLTAAMLAGAEQRQEDYYQAISDQEFSRYMWLNEHRDDYTDPWHSFDKAAIEPQKAAVFSAVSGVHTICSDFWPWYGLALPNHMRGFLRSNGSDPGFLEQHDIGVVIGDMDSDILTEIHERTYLYYGLPPRANVTLSPGQPAAGEEVVFTSTASTPYGRLVDWQWEAEGENMEGSITGLTLAEGQRLRAPLEMNGSFTIDLWLRPHFDHDDGRDHEWFRWAGNGGYVVLYKHSNSRLYFVVRQDTWRAAWTVIPFQAGDWHHLAAAYQGGQFLLYWDGNLVRFDSGGDRLTGGAGTLTLGGVADRWFNGTLREVRLYNRALTAQEVADSYAGGPPGEGLAGWWPLDDGGEAAVERLSGGEVKIGNAQWLNQAWHVFEEPGTYTVELTVRNQDGLTDTVTRSITVS